MAKEIDLEKKALKILEDNRDICFFKDLAAELGIGRSTLYWKNLDKLDTIRDALNQNSILMKRALRNKWYVGDNATTQIALYRLLADDDETARLNSAKLELEHSGKVTLMPSVKIGSKNLELNIGDDVD